MHGQNLSINLRENLTLLRSNSLKFQPMYTQKNLGDPGSSRGMFWAHPGGPNSIQRLEFQRITAQQSQVLPEVELRFSPCLILPQYWTWWPDLSSSLCPWIPTLLCICIEKRGLRSASGDRTSDKNTLTKWLKIAPRFGTMCTHTAV